MAMKLPLIFIPIFLLVLFYPCTIALSQAPAQSPTKSPAPKSSAESPATTKSPAPKSRAEPPSEAQSPSKPPPAQTPIDQPLVQPPSLLPLVPAPPTKAPAPAPAGPDVAKILEKAGGFTILVRLLRATQVINQIQNQLAKTSNSLTILAPPNAAFSGLKSGTLNSLNAEQRVQLLQFHVIPTYISLANFDTVSNPVRTQASDTDNYPLNVTTSGKVVSLSTGLVNASISGTVYSDDQVVIYKVDKVLLPLGIFAPRPKPPAPSPAPAKKPKKEDPSSSSSSGDDVVPPAAALNLSGGTPLAVNVIAPVALAAVAVALLM